MQHFKQKIQKYNRRMIISGNVLEKYNYERTIVQGRSKKSIGRANQHKTSNEVKKINRSKTAFRAKTMIRRTANANADTLTKFFTLTFAKNITDIDIANYEFEKFVKRLKTVFCPLLYIKVIEFQKRGAIHFHLLCNLPFIEANKLSQIWGNGFVKINRIDNVDNIGAYLTKYMTKDNIDERLIGKKSYSMSKGLKKPVTITDEEEIEEIALSLENVTRVYTTAFDSEYLGKVEYTQIVCNDFILPNYQRKRRARTSLNPKLDAFYDDSDNPFL